MIALFFLLFLTNMTFIIAPLVCGIKKKLQAKCKKKKPIPSFIEAKPILKKNSNSQP